MRLLFVSFIAALCAAPAGHAGQATGDGSYQLAEVIYGGDVSTQSGKKNPVPGMRPQRFVCVIDPPDSAKADYKYSCPAKPGRVGGSCRCSGTVGSGTLLSY